MHVWPFFLLSFSFIILPPVVSLSNHRGVRIAKMKRKIDEQVHPEVIDLVDSDDDNYVTDVPMFRPGSASKANVPLHSPGSASKATNATYKVYLMVPYTEKDLAKELGAKYDAEQKLWYVLMDADNKNIVSILSVFNERWGVYLDTRSADYDRVKHIGAMSGHKGCWFVEPNSNLNDFAEWLGPSTSTRSISSTLKTVSSSTKESVIDSSVAKLSVLSWNVNGIGDNYGVSRMSQMCDIIVKQNVDIVLLQEVVIPIYDKLLSILTALNYRPLNTASVTCIYFTVAFIKNSGDGFNMSVLESTRTPFASSHMGRDYCVNKIRIEKHLNYHDITIVNTHLESLKEYSEVRKSQLKQCLGSIDVVNGTGLLVGDLNIRKNEMVEVKSCRKFNDVWEDHSKDAAEENTWFGQGEVVGFKARYDRMLYIDNAASLKYSDFKLIGKERYTFLDEFSVNGDVPKSSTVSDHLCMLGKFNISLNNRLFEPISKEEMILKRLKRLEK